MKKIVALLVVTSMLTACQNEPEPGPGVAHGGTPNAKKMRALDGSSLGNINAFAQELDGVLRVALRAAIALHAKTGKFHDEKDWDALILRDDA